MNEERNATPTNIVCLDIETSGLNPQNSFITCIGVATVDGIHQFSGRNRADEKTILEKYFSLMDDLGDGITLLTYNGLKFDVPFILYRCEQNGISNPFLGDYPLKHIDMVQYATEANGGIRIPKDLFLSKYLNFYVPRSCSGAWMARMYSTGKMPMDGHLQNVMHNAIDLAMTLRAYGELMQYDDFQDFCKRQIEISKMAETSTK